VILIAATRSLKTEPYETSRSRGRKLRAVSHGNASEDDHDVVSRNEADTVTNISMRRCRLLHCEERCARFGEGLPTRRTAYFAAVAWLTSISSFKRLAVDAGRIQKRVSAVDLPDQITNFAID
jgi:hypothetical protein